MIDSFPVGKFGLLVVIFIQGIFIGLAYYDFVVLFICLLKGALDNILTLFFAEFHLSC